MFVSDSHLPQLLGTEHYCSPTFLDRELRLLLGPGWHLVGTVFDLPRDSNFVTLELFARPLIVLRQGARDQTFLNIGSHGYSMLTHALAGCASRLRWVPVWAQSSMRVSPRPRMRRLVTLPIIRRLTERFTDRLLAEDESILPKL